MAGGIFGAAQSLGDRGNRIDSAVSRGSGEQQGSQQGSKPLQLGTEGGGASIVNNGKDYIGGAPEKLDYDRLQFLANTYGKSRYLDRVPQVDQTDYLQRVNQVPTEQRGNYPIPQQWQPTYDRMYPPQPQPQMQPQQAPVPAPQPVAMGRGMY